MMFLKCCCSPGWRFVIVFAGDTCAHQARIRLPALLSPEAAGVPPHMCDWHVGSPLGAPGLACAGHGGADQLGEQQSRVSQASASEDAVDWPCLSGGLWEAEPLQHPL